MKTTYQFPLNTYAGDGRCHNANAGTFNHECGKPAVFVGTKRGGTFRTGFCAECAMHGTEANGYHMEPIATRDTDAKYAYVVTK